MELILWNGICTGCVYVLVAIGFNIVYVASGTFNFAQPQYLVVGTFLSYVVSTTWGLSPWIAVLLGLVIGGVVGLLEERLAVRLLAGAGLQSALVTTVGWSVAMEGVVLLIWKSNPLTVKGIASNTQMEVAGIHVTAAQIVMVIVVVVLAIAVHLWFKSTKVGIAMLAMAEDRQAAQLRGINVRRLSMGAFVLAGALLAAMGPIMGPQIFATYNLGDTVVLFAFVAMAVGGFGHNIGSLVGGLALGVLQAIISLYWGDHWMDILTFAVLLLVLSLLPQGFFGRRGERLV
jgi:branched-chain amino acid transport system permease protein